MGEYATPDQSVALVVSDKQVDADDPLPVTVVAGSGSAAVTIADGSDVAEGAKADAAWSGSGNGTVVSILKAIYGKVAATLGFSTNAGTTDATTLRVITASDGPLNTNLGATADAAVTTDVNGSVSSKLRGLVKIFADVWDSTNHRLAVDESTARRGTVTDRSGTISSGGVAQQLAASNATRKYLLIVNPITATETLWFNFTTTAVTASPSIGLAPGDSFVMEGAFVSTEAISVIAATTAHAFTAKEG